VKPRIYSKQYAGHSCPHGLKFYFVDGAEVRKKGYGDFVFGGNGFRYPSFVPRNELWLERTIDQKEVHFVAFHECHETEKMREGQSYDQAHEAAKRLEDKARRNAGPLRKFMKEFFSFPNR
jgi:hypothetical protein